MRSLDSSLKEKKRHGETSFPIKYYHEVLNSEKKVNFHWHDEFEIIYIKDGEGILFLNNTKFDLKKGDFVFLTNNDIHSFESETFCDCDVLLMNLNLLKSLHVDSCEIKYLDFMHFNNYRIKSIYREEEMYIKPIFDRIISLLRLDITARELFIKGKLYELFGELFMRKIITEADSNYKKKIKHRTLVKSALEYIGNNYNQEIGVASISRYVGVSEFYFCRIFKEVMGKTFISYLNEYRIQTSIALLKNFELSITEVSLEVGYGGLSYFIKTFKEYIGKTPRQFRRELYMTS